MPEPLFTTVEYEATCLSHVDPGPCEPPPLLPPMIARECDVDGFYTLRFEQIFVVCTRLDDDHCHIASWTIVERYHSNEACRLYEPPPDLDMVTEWLSYLQPTPLSWDWPPPAFPRQSIEPAVHVGNGQFACESDVRITYSAACVAGRIHVTRHTHITVSTPLPDGLCRKIECVNEELHATNEPCEPEDWVDAPPSYSAGHDLEALWKQGALNELPPRPPIPGDYYRLGSEWDPRTPFRRSVRDIHKQELAMGKKLTQESARFVEIRSIAGKPPTATTLADLDKTKPVVVVIGLEGSDVAAKSVVRFVDATQG
jgi:hypothetical protein